MQPNDLLTPQEVAVLLKVSRRTVTEYGRNGTLTPVRYSRRMVRFHRADVMKLQGKQKS